MSEANNYKSHRRPAAERERGGDTRGGKNMTMKKKILILCCALLCVTAVFAVMPTSKASEQGRTFVATSTDADGTRLLKEGKNIIIGGSDEQNMTLYSFVMPYDGHIIFSTDIKSCVMYEIVDGEKVYIEDIGFMCEEIVLHKGIRYYMGFYGKGYNNEYTWMTKVTFVPVVTDLKVTPISTVMTQIRNDCQNVKYKADITYSDGTTESKTEGMWTWKSDRGSYISASYEAGGKKYDSSEKLPVGKVKVILSADSGVHADFYITVRGLSDIAKGVLRQGTNILSYGNTSQADALFKFVPDKTAKYMIGPSDDVDVYMAYVSDGIEKMTGVSWDGADDSGYNFKLVAGRTYYISFRNKKFVNHRKICVAIDDKNNWEKSGHDFIWKIYRAGFNKDGVMKHVCSVCGRDIGSKDIIAAGEIKLGKVDYVYNGMPCKPKVTLYNVNKKVISSNSYSVSYEYNNQAGWAVAKVTLKGKYYKGLGKEYFYITPKRPEITALKNLKNGVLITWKKVPGASQYCITDENDKSVVVNASKGTSLVLKVNSPYFGEDKKYTVTAYGNSKYGSMESKPSAKKGIFYITPVKLTRVTNTAAGRLTWRGKCTEGVNGAQLQYSTSKDMSNAKFVNVSCTSDFYDVYGTTPKLFARGKTYYVRLRASYTKKTGKTKQVTYGDWGNVIKVYIRK